MGRILVFILLIAGFVIFFYYLYLIFIGKRLAHMVGSKDRYIWNGLKNISTGGSPLSGTTNTLFLDDSNLVISRDNLDTIYKELKNTGGLEHALAIPFQKIITFDYENQLAHSNPVVKFFSAIWNRLLKKNNFILNVRYLDEERTPQSLYFKATSLDVNDFEATFADFDNKIYSGKVERGAIDEALEVPKKREEIQEVRKEDTSTVLMPKVNEEIPFETSAPLVEPKEMEEIVPVKEELPRSRATFGVKDLHSKPEENEETVVISPFHEEEKTVLVDRKAFLEDEVIFERPKDFKKDE
ncbi:hypothetical protein [Guggenheimella bovis]